MKGGKDREHKSPKLSEADKIVRRLREFRTPQGEFDYAECGQAVAVAHQIYNDAFELTKFLPKDTALSKACAESYRLWVKAFDAVYRPGFWEDVVRLRAGDPSGLESAVAFLEANPYFHRSGYTKEKLIRFLKPLMLAHKHTQRLIQVVLMAVDARDDRHFRAFCRLARKVDAPALREQLTARLTSGDAGIRRRARWVLEALAQKDSQEKGSEQSSQEEKQK